MEDSTEKNMNNEVKTIGPFKDACRGVIPIIENQMENERSLLTIPTLGAEVYEYNLRRVLRSLGGCIDQGKKMETT